MKVAIQAMSMSNPN